MVLRSGDTAAVYKLSDISLEYNAIFDEQFATTASELYARATAIPYTKVTSIRYQKLSKSNTTWKIGVRNLSICLLQGLLLLFPDKRDNFANKNKKVLRP